MYKHVLIVGGGFAGLWAGLAAAREADIAGGGIAITLASRDDHLTLRPRLYEQKPGALPGAVAADLGDRRRVPASGQRA